MVAIGSGGEEVDYSTRQNQLGNTFREPFRNNFRIAVIMLLTFLSGYKYLDTML